MTPRVLDKAAAAAYCGCTVRAFDDWVERGIVPGAIPGTHRWDRKAIDFHLDQASGLSMEPSDQLTPYQRWKADEEAKGKAA